NVCKVSRACGHCTEVANMAESPMLGAKVRQLRRREKLTQAELATRLGVSASYLNLIENNRRPLTASVLLKLAQEFHIDLSTFGSSEEARMVSDLREVFGDPMLDGDAAVTALDLKELVSTQPAIARAMIDLYRGYTSTRESAEMMAEQLQQAGTTAEVFTNNPTEEINDLLQRHDNHFAPLEDAAERLWDEAELDFDDVYGGLIAYLEKKRGIEVRVVEAEEGQAMRRYDEKRSLITLSEVLPPRSRRFQLAHQTALITQQELFDSLALEDELNSEASRAMVPIVLANYFAAAVLMPYDPFLEAAEAVRYDIELLAHRYRTSFEQVCHRLTTLRRPGHEGIPLHFIRIDIAGNISKRFSASGIRMPRFSGACPRWNVHAAFLTPGMIRVQISRMTDGSQYFCIARTVQRATGGYNIPHTIYSIGLGCPLRYAKRMVYSDGVALDSADAASPVGTTCRTCDRLECEQRVFPPMQTPLTINKHVRGTSFFSPIAHLQNRSPRRSK
ncbi:MAG: short-chain fatty acyl-CoA regulator family protein, partial [Myxococcota bacterium]